jgi:erythromycin esterase
VRYTRLIAQFLDAYSGANLSNGRDGYMAENIIRLVNAAPPGTRFVVWGHNGHIERSGQDAAEKSMGSILASVYGDAYYALGFAFNQGSFQSRDLAPAAKRALTAFTVGPAPEKSLDWHLARAAGPLYVIDFRHAPRNPTVARWLSRSQPSRWMGALYDGRAPSFMTDVTPAKHFDGMLFVERTTRARPNPSVHNVAPLR